VNSNFTELYNTAPILTNLTVGNSSVNTFANSSYLRTTNGAFTDAVRVGNSSVYSVVNGTFFSATAHNADRLGGAYANQYINVTSNFTLSGILTFNDDIVLGSNARIVANSSGGSNGDVLFSNGTAVYWSTPPIFNVNNAYTWTNTQIFQKTVSFGNNVSITGNVSSNGTLTVTGNVSSNGTLTVTGNVSSNGTLTVTGNVSSNGNLTVSGNLSISKTLSANGSTGTSGFVLTSSGSGNVYWGSALLPLISNSSSSSDFYFPMSSSATGFWSNGVVANNKLYFIPSTGTLTATNFNSLSDKNKKTDIQIIEDAIEIINSLNGVRFVWKDTGEKSAGLLAQDVENKIPELVKTNNNGIKSLNYSGIIAVLVEAVKYLLEKDKENR
jgi:hypothetical protein